MRFKPMGTADPGDFFAVSGWSSKTAPNQVLVQEQPETREPVAFEATVIEGEPRVGERYRFEEDGQTILVEVTEVTRPKAGDDLMVKGAVIGR